MTKRLIIIEQSALTEGGHYFSYTRTIAQAARNLEFDTLILENKRFVGDWNVEGVKAKAAFTHTWGEAAHLWIEAWGPGNLAYEFLEATRADPPGQSDLVFAHTMSYAELRNMLVYLTALPQGLDLPVFHLLLRYDPDVLQGSIEVFKPLFDGIAISPRLLAHIRFHTDTDPLSSAYTRLSGVPFTTLPIPFLQDRLRERMAEDVSRQARRPLTVTYLGDARMEKNYASLPAAIARLWPEYGRTGRVRFVLQSNFNVANGEPGMLEAVQRLGQYPTRFVELITEPMSYEDYYDRLFESDAVVIPYDAKRYCKRSSGVLIEAMAAGKPVVTTAGSWMAGIVDASHAVVCEDPDDLGASLETLLRNFDALKKGADGRAEEMLAWSSGENFVRALVNEAERGASSPPDGPRILIVIDGDAIALRNGAGRLAKTQLDYLTRASFRICALFVMRSLGGDAAQARRATEALRREIAPFSLEAAFLAGPGRLSLDGLDPSPKEWDVSIAADVAAMSDLDIPMDLAGYVMKNTIDVVFCNYVQTLPILRNLGLAGRPSICEVIDIQSFQKAIYGRRPIRADDLALEFELLEAFDRLISLNPLETAYIEERLPGARITTTGIVVDAEPPTFRSLAGFVDIAELLAGCGPNTQDRHQGWIDSLAGLTSIDLVYVSSNHLANVSGLRWFLYDVYIPYLADAGVTMVIAGSIAEVGDWPEHRNLIFIGRVKDVVPLYAAGKVVVIPITEGAGMPVKTAEALSYGRPVVATRTAMRGTEIDSSAVALADEPAAFAAAVRDLLDSPEKRQSAGERARGLAMRINHPDRYVRLMNEVFADLLGPKARAVEIVARPDVRPPLLVEWNSLVSAVNRLYRSWLANEPVDEATTGELLRHPQADVLAVVTEVGNALLDERSAAALMVSTPLARNVAKILSGGSAAIVAFVEFLLGFLSEASLPPTVLAELAWLPRHPLDVTLVGGADVVKALTLGGASPEPARQINSMQAHSWHKAANPEAHYDLDVVRLAHRSGQALVITRSAFAVVASQTIPLRADASILTRPIIEGKGSVVRLNAGDKTRFFVPPLPSRPKWRRWVDVCGACAADATLIVTLREHPIEARVGRHDGQITLRVEIPASNAFRATELGVMALNGPVMLLSASIHSVHEAGVENVLDLTHGLKSGDRKIPDELALGPPGALLRSLLVDGHRMNAHSGDLARFLRERLTPNARSSKFNDLAGEVGRALDANPKDDAGSGDRKVESRMLATLIWPMTAIAEGANRAVGARFVGAHSLSFAVVVSDKADGWTCAVDGEVLLPGPSGNIWSCPGVPDNGLPSLRTIVWRDARGAAMSPASPRLIMGFPAGQDVATKARHLTLDNAYEREMFNERDGLFWTGPGAQTSFTMPCALSGPTEIILQVCNFGAIEKGEDLSLLVNGKPLTIEVRRFENEGTIVGHYDPGKTAEPAVTTMDLLVRQAHWVPGDNRKLGIAIVSMQFSMGL